MNFQITRQRKMLITLGVGAVALTAIACGSAVPKDDLPVGDPPSAAFPASQSDNEFELGALGALGAPAGVGDALPPTGSVENAGNTSAASGAVDGGVRGEAVVSGLPVAPGYDCESGSVRPATPPVDGEPVYDLPVTNEPISLGVPAPGFAPEDVVEMIVLDHVDQRNLDDGDAGGVPVLTVPVLTLYDVPVLISVDAPGPVDSPSVMPISEGSGTSVEDAPPPIAMSATECGSGFSDPSVSVETISNTDGVLLHEIAGNSGADLPDDVKIVEAPIETAGITIAESLPPQYFLSVVSGLPNGATTFGFFAVKRDGNTVLVMVANFVRTDIAAIQLYGVHNSNIALGSDFTSGEVYAVVINGNTVTEFTAQ